MKNESFKLKPSIGQHLLKDEGIKQRIIDAVPPHHTVLEVGAGPGNLTERLAKKSKRVIAVEVDNQFELALSQVQKENPNVEVVFDDAIKVVDSDQFQETGRRENVWVTGNIPYHISEPLISRLAESNVEGATMLVGARFAESVKAPKGSHIIGRLGLTARTFFEPEVDEIVDQESFEPQPRVQSAVVRLRRRSEVDFRKSKPLFLMRRILGDGSKTLLVKKVLKDGFSAFTFADSIDRSKKARHRHSRRQTHRRLNRLVRTYAWRDLTAQNQKHGMGLQAEIDDKTAVGNQYEQFLSRTEISSKILNKTCGQLTNRDFAILEEKLNAS